ncbi:MAG TPA: pyridoxal phosphate-dependent aminotransferase, partial [Thermogutta sp.]|nr:pyridoxal phosphate-dependent aminotransferase [Thermogutta sp.]
LADKHGIALVSDEIYRDFCYDGPFTSPAQFYPKTIVVEGLSKSHGMPGWRVGFAHGPKAIIQQMIKLQQYSFVCAPQPFQWAAATALDCDMSAQYSAYRRKRDMVVQGLQGYYELQIPEGAFYAFPKAPWGSATEFVTTAIEKFQLLIIPGNVFSRRDTHFRISYAASDETIQKGIEVLREMAHRPA